MQFRKLFLNTLYLEVNAIGHLILIVVKVGTNGPEQYFSN